MIRYDGRGPSTLLTELVLARRGVSSPQELVRSIYGAEAPRLEVASLADLVEQSAGHRACESPGLTFARMQHMSEPAEGAMHLALKMLSG